MSILIAFFQLINYDEGMINVDVISEIQGRIAAAAKRSGRTEQEVELLAVSKMHTREEVLVAKSLGLTHFGENRVIEAVDKFEGIDGVTVDLIGQLQTNKVKKCLPFFRNIQSVDSLHLAEKIASEAEKKQMVQPIFLEQNCSNEASKSGFLTLDALREAVEAIRQFPTLIITGLMTVGPLCDDERQIRKAFQDLRHSFSVLKEQDGLDSLKELSMGMSGDFEWAIEEGSTLVRVGTSLFGHRDYANKNSNGVPIV